MRFSADGPVRPRYVVKAKSTPKRGWGLQSDDDSDEEGDKLQWEEQSSSDDSDSEFHVEETRVVSAPVRDTSVIQDYRENDPLDLKQLRFSTYRDPHDEWLLFGNRASYRKAQVTHLRSSARAGHIERIARQSLRDQYEDNCAKEMEAMAEMMEEMRIQAREEEDKVKQAFEERQRLLWESIEEAIAFTTAADAEVERKRKEKEAEEEGKRKAEERLQQEEQRKRDEVDALHRALEKAAQIKKEAEEKEAAEEAKRQADEAAEKQRRAAEEEEARLKIEADSLFGHLPPCFVHEKERLDNLRRVLKEGKARIQADSRLLNGCRQLERTITGTLGKMSSNRSNIEETAAEIHGAFAQGRQESVDVYGYLLNVFAKTIVKQSVEEIERSAPAAYPLAICTMLLIGQYRHAEALSDVMYMRLNKKCWWVTGLKPPKPDEIQTEEEYDIWLGQGADEKEEPYVKRQIAYVALYAALCQVQTNVPIPVNSGIWLGNLWRLFSVWLKQPQSADWHCPAVISNVIEYAGLALEEEYGEFQMNKLLAYIEALNDADEEDPKRLGVADLWSTGEWGRNRLRTVINKWKTGERFSEGRLWVEDDPTRMSISD